MIIWKIWKFKQLLWNYFGDSGLIFVNCYIVNFFGFVSDVNLIYKLLLCSLLKSDMQRFVYAELVIKWWL